MAALAVWTLMEVDRDVPNKSSLLVIFMQT
jgi:hypothetical protein